jgi:hypothetical protein
MPGTRRFVVERVTRIELALSAWEVQRSRLLAALTWQYGCPLVAVVAPSSPWLMARRSCGSSPRSFLVARTGARGRPMARRPGPQGAPATEDRSDAAVPHGQRHGLDAVALAKIMGSEEDASPAWKAATRSLLTSDTQVIATALAS